MDNVTSLDNMTSSEKATIIETFTAQRVEDAIVRYLFPVVILVGNVTTALRSVQCDYCIVTTAMALRHHCLLSRLVLKTQSLFYYCTVPSEVRGVDVIMFFHRFYHYYDSLRHYIRPRLYSIFL